MKVFNMIRKQVKYDLLIMIYYNCKPRSSIKQICFWAQSYKLEQHKLFTYNGALHHSPSITDGSWCNYFQQ